MVAFFPHPAQLVSICMAFNVYRDKADIFFIVVSNPQKIDEIPVLTCVEKWLLGPLNVFFIYSSMMFTSSYCKRLKLLHQGLTFITRGSFCIPGCPLRKSFLLIVSEQVGELETCIGSEKTRLC